MTRRQIFPLVFFFAILVLACDIPFLAQEKKATFLEGTPEVAATIAPDSTAIPGASSTDTAPSAGDAQPTRRAAPTATRVPPSVYVASLRVDPPQPRSGPGPVTFFVRFQSTFTTKQPVKWLVKIFRPGEAKSFGETAALTLDIPPGASELASANNWHTNPFQCETFVARVFWVETGVYADPIEFKKPDRSNTPFVEFKVCP